MKQPAQPSHLQLNLSLLNAPTAAIPGEKQKELTLALVELLISAVGESLKPQAEGGESESETNR